MGHQQRLADGTKSPWVAAFFAVSGSWEADGTIYGFRQDLFEDEVDAKFRAEVSRLFGVHTGAIWNSIKNGT
jgi:hypothetical protein